MDSSYIRVVNDIMGRRRFGSRPGVEISAELLEKAGNPEKDLRIIHIAGTNGKGSVAAYTAGVLSRLGYRTGLFTSPHLVDFRERICVDGEKIPEADVIRLCKTIDDMGETPTMFDISFVMAMLYFSEEKCDFAVIETGLGGRLDSTSAISKAPKVCVITGVGLDHTDVLGDTIEKIAFEKAGIIKPGSRVVAGSMPTEALEVIRARCNELSCELFVSDVPESAPFFEKNHSTAFLALQALGIDISRDRFDEIVSDITFCGRLQRVKEEPIFYVDGAHNPPATQSLCETLRLLYPGSRFVFVFGAISGHDTAGVIEKLLPIAEIFFVVGISDQRAYTNDEICDMIRDAGKEAVACESVKDALGRAAAKAKELDIPAVACGSLYLVGEILHEIQITP